MKPKEEAKKVLKFVKENPVKTLTSAVLVATGLYLYVDWFYFKRKK